MRTAAQCALQGPRPKAKLWKGRNVTLHSVSHCRAALLIGAFVVTLLPAAALAGPRAGAVVHLANGMTFNWLAKKKTSGAQLTNSKLLSSADTTDQTATRFFGHGSYICSPAGFGHKSSCFAR